jgi:tetratricopeptide (TPR) repeat protein
MVIMYEWNEFPFDNQAYDYQGEALSEIWDQLHDGDREPFPEDERLQEAWRCYHRGDFQQAVILADECGLQGHAVANKATGMYASHLEKNEQRQIECYKSAIARAEKAVIEFPDEANSHHFYAFNLGRYSQCISIVKALKQGIGGKIMSALTRALEIDPDHADAHTALGLYHAEIIDKIGKLIGGVTYGASEKKAIEHFKKALVLAPGSPIAHIEYGNGLYMLYGDRRVDEVSSLYERATELTPGDAVEKLDVELALAEFE